MWNSCYIDLENYSLEKDRQNCTISGMAPNTSERIVGPAPQRQFLPVTVRIFFSCDTN